MADDLTEQQIKAFRIADNKVAEHSTWDQHLLSIELQDLIDMDFDIAVTDFDEEEILKNIEPHNIEELLQDLEMSEAVEKPIWAVVRTSNANQEILETALEIIENQGIRIERSYEKKIKREKKSGTRWIIQRLI